MSNKHLKHHAYQFPTTESKNQPINHKFNNKLAAFQNHTMETNKQLAILQDHVKKSLGNNQLQLIQIQYQLKNHHKSHHSYQHCQYKLNTQTFQDHQHSTTENQPFQDHHQPTTTDFTSNIALQDLILPDTTHIQPFQDQQTTDTTHSHYFQDHHANTRTSSQDHIHSISRHKNTSSQDHINSHKDTVHSKYSMYIFPYHTHHNTALHEDRRQQVIKTFLL